MANSSMGLLEALSQQSAGLGVNDWYQPAPYELPLMANHPGAFRIPPGSEYSPSRKRWETPEGRRFDAPAPTIGSVKWLVGAMYPEVMYRAMEGDNTQ